MRSAIKSTKELSSFLGIEAVETNYKVFIPLAFANKLKTFNKNSPLWKQFVPNNEELNRSGYDDPIGDMIHLKEKGIIHRYKNRILFTPTNICPIQCRYCFRKNELEGTTNLVPSIKKLETYLLNNSDVQEVIFTGGDPLVLDSSKIDKYLAAISTYKNIKFIRFHSRVPVILPERIDNEFIELINKYSTRFKTISIAVHANHIDEFSIEMKEACLKLQRAGVNLLSQSVLLKDVNDSEEDLINLYEGFNDYNIRSYYLHHPDQVRGAMHFYLSLEEGRRIYAKLRQSLAGWLIPHYIIDTPSGIGKTLAYNPESIEYSGEIIDSNFKIHEVSFPKHSEITH